MTDESIESLIFSKLDTYKRYLRDIRDRIVTLTDRQNQLIDAVQVLQNRQNQLIDAVQDHEARIRALEHG